jgi:integrase
VGRGSSQQAERERRYLTHAELLMLARAADRFKTLTLVLGYCDLRFGEAVALRRKHAGGPSADGQIVPYSRNRQGHCRVDDQDEAGSSRAST